MDKTTFLKDAQNFIEQDGLDLDRDLPILAHDYDTLIDLGFDYMPTSTGHLSFTLYLTDKALHGPSLYIVVVANTSDPNKIILMYHACTIKTEYHSFVGYTLDEVLNKIIEEAKK